jgi:methionine-S-sulfoxide reductase
MMAKAYLACGCFWGAQYYLDKLNGVKKTIVGYMGGKTDSPSYEAVCSKKTGHLEATEVEFDASMVSYDEVVRYFFEIHDFEQVNGQGPDLGEQYLSAVFVGDENEKKVVENVIEELRQKGYKVATQIREAGQFWPAEGYHQDYYKRKGSRPYCHGHRKIF